VKILSYRLNSSITKKKLKLGNLRSIKNKKNDSKYAIHILNNPQSYGQIYQTYDKTEHTAKSLIQKKFIIHTTFNKSTLIKEQEILFFFNFPMALQALKDLGRLTYRRFFELFRHMVGFLPWTNDQPIARPLPTPDNTTQNDADKHPCLERDLNPQSQQLTGKDPRLRPHGYCDRQYYCYNRHFKLAA
jgi:hypothetical protein